MASFMRPHAALPKPCIPRPSQEIDPEVSRHVYAHFQEMQAEEGYLTFPQITQMHTDSTTSAPTGGLC
jgi:hypothetical protein